MKGQRAESVLQKLGQRVGSPVVSNAITASLYKTLRREHAKALARPDYDAALCKAILWHRTKDLIGKFNVTERDIEQALDTVIPGVRLDKRRPITIVPEEKLTGVWPALKKHWRTMAPWQKCLWVLCFPVCYVVLSLVVWRDKRDGRNSGVSKS